MQTARNFIRQANRDSIVIAELCKVHQTLSVLDSARVRFADCAGTIDLQLEIEALERALRLLGME